MQARIQRFLENRWFAAIAALAIGYIAVHLLMLVLNDAYHVYYAYPQGKGAEYIYPELRYTFGQIALLLWSVLGLSTMVLTARSALFRSEQKWASRLIMALVLGFVLLVVGFIVGAAMRDFGF